MSVLENETTKQLNKYERKIQKYPWAVKATGHQKGIVSEDNNLIYCGRSKMDMKEAEVI